ncbi:MAG: FAD-binding oxidoreductase [Burkholderiales bacterium]|nr:FAD-binding oxidoreductase [Burkholderiales bacterium]
MSHAAACAALADELPALAWTRDDAQLTRLSQDFSWFSPVLKRQLEGKRGDIAVRPRNEDEIRAVVAACARRRVPVTVRGSGTGNYGQIVPVQGGLILDLSGFNAFGWARGGAGRAQAGIRLGDFDRAAQPLGWELRWLPSTFRAASLGGLFGGGFGGAGSVTYGPIAAAGNVLGARVMSVEPEPQVAELRGAEALLVHHRWGTNGIVLELEVALAPALPWVEMIATFEALPAAIDFCMTLHGATPGIVRKELALMCAPIPEYFVTLAEHLPQGRHAVLMLVAETSEGATRELAGAHGGDITYRKDAAEVKRLNRTLVEYCWNHTTLQALKVDRNLTYLQARFDPLRQKEQVLALHDKLSPEVMLHLEYIRLTDGRYTCSSLPVVRFSTEERLAELGQVFEEHGVVINNAHTHVLEDGGKLRDMDRSALSAAQRMAAEAAVAMKQRFDPAGLLNPGKLRSWHGPG